MTAKKQDLVREIATRASAVDYWAFMHYLPNPDPVLKKWVRTSRHTVKFYQIATWVVVFAAVKRQLKGWNGDLPQRVIKSR
ncbi:Uncharacterised protein [Avibacterium paragallinarum]|uniref:Uncharacterized protein n=2 Tax=Avibacterium paragallinarum TaxID=728 RepID=A0A380Z041_AVIPA|nr:hypothetical protein [Avibacterium paragallinarum]SUV40321.1 Uncharacterised protein [Avibacterium paragallinarum]